MAMHPVDHLTTLPLLATGSVALFEPSFATPAIAAPSAVPEKKANAPVTVAPIAVLNQAVERLNAVVQALAPALEFSIDDSTARTVVKVIDQHTQEVIRQIPSEEALEIAKALDRMQGLLIRQSA